MLKALIKAHDWLKRIKARQSLTQIAADDKVSEGHIRAHLPLALLSPKIQSAIVKGTHPVELTLDRLIKSKLPLDWHTQEQSIRP